LLNLMMNIKLIIKPLLVPLCAALLYSGALKAQEDSFTLNLKNADIHSLIQTVSRQSGKNFVVDPRVKARVTVISANPLSAEELYETFLSVLQVHGYAAVPGDDLIKIVPEVNAKQGPVPNYDGSSSDQLVTQVIKVQNVPAAQLVPILRPLVPQQGHLAAYAATNTLIVTDRANNIQRLITIINGVDRPDNEEVEIIRLNFASASEVIRILGAIQSRAGQVGGAPGSVRFAADERTNSILLSGDQSARVRMRSLVANLDTPVESGGNTRVVYLRFANAADLLQILTGVSAGQAKIGTSTSAEDGGAVAAAAPAAPTVNANGAAVPQAPTASLVRRANQESDRPNVDIQADEDTNALIITAPPDEMRSILAVIEQLDIRRAQVLVEAIIAELSENNSAQLGVNFAVNGTANNRPAAYTNLGGATQALAGTIAGAAAGTATGLSSGLSLALGRFGNGGVDFGFLLSAIASDSDNNILSTPTLVTMDNQEAEIVVGQNVPFVTGTQLSSANNNPFQTIERQDIGISLKVKPQINEGDNIKMDIEQEVSDVSSTSVTGASDITTNKRSIKTTVLVEDGQTLVLGGLIDDQISDTHDKVPFLGDVPLLGSLFRYRTTTKSKRNLMVFLHPTILRDIDTADYYSRSKYDDLRTAQLGLFDQDDMLSRTPPELPELHLYYGGQRVNNVKDALNTIVPTSELTINSPPMNANLPTINRLPAQAGADRAIGPFDASN
jgi:general secretion pathway protein D